MEKSKFLQEVREELENIKKNATPNEIARLNLETFDHSSHTLCIYGQMTGSCDTSRARELQPKSYDRIQVEGQFVSPEYNPFKSQSYAKGSDFTALEKYLFMVKTKTQANIIQYLKGDIDKITLR